MGKIYGFTGTHHGMTEARRKTFRYLLLELCVIELHHGDCIGADAQAHRDATRMQIELGVHPPTDEKRRAFCDYSLPNKLYPAKPLLVRDRDIVQMGKDGLIATPRGKIELLRSGTWATIRYARKLKRTIHFIWPDGTFKVEENK